MQAQPFQKTFGDAIANEQIHFKHLSNGDLFFIGRTDAMGDDDIWVAKVDSNLNTIWSNRYRYNSQDEWAKDIVPYNNGYYLSGTRDGSYIITYLQIATNGNLQQYQTMGFFQDRMYGLLTSYDSKIVNYGFLENFAPGSYNRPSVMTMDQNLNIQVKRNWRPSTGSNPEQQNGEQYSRWMGQFSDSTYVMVSQFSVFNNNAQEWRFQMLDKNFNLTTVRGLTGNANPDRINSGCINPDNTFMVVGSTENYGAVLQDGFIGKFDQQGNPIWLKRYGSIGDEQFESIIPDGNGGHYAVGHTTSFGAGQEDGLIAHLDSLGNIIWVKAYGGAAQDELERIDTLNGFYVTSGFTHSYSTNGSSDGWIVMIDSTGNLNDSCNTDITGSFGSSTVTASTTTRMYGAFTFGNPSNLSGTANTYGIVDSLQCFTCNAPNFSLPADTTLCSEDSITIFNPDTSFSTLWHTGDTTDQITVPAGTTVWLELTNDSANCPATDTMEVFAQNPPAVDLGNDTSFCLGDSLAIGITNTSGSTYAWNTGDSVSLIWATTADTFELTVTDNIGCINQDTLIVNENDLPLFNLINDTIACFGDTVILYPDSMHTSWNYLWSNSNSSDSLAVSQTGNYTLSITDTNNCQHIDSTALQFNAMPQLNLGTDTLICDQDTLSIGHSFTGYQSIWNTGDTVPTISAAQNGTFSIVVNDSIGCFVSDTIDISIQPLPAVNLGPDQVICQFDSTQLNAPANLNYGWSNGANSASISVSQTGTYFVEVTDSVGCSSSDTAVIGVSPLPQPVITGNPNACTGDWVQLNVQPNGNQVLWSNGDTVPSTEFAQAQTAWVQLTNANGCSNRDSILINFYPLPQPNLGSDTSICLDSLTLFPGSFSSYNWSTGGSSAQETVYATNLYVVTVTSTQNCSFADSVVVEFLPNPRVDLGPDTVICSADSFSLVVADSLQSTIYWNGSVGTGTFSIDNSGLYSVELVKNYGGCFDEDSIQITVLEAPPLLDWPEDTTLCTGLSFPVNVDATGGFNFDWSDGHRFLNRNLNQPIPYCLTLENKCGTTEECIRVELEDCNCNYFIPEVFTPNGDGLNEVFQPIFECERFEFDFRIYNRWGEQVFRTSNPEEFWDGRHNGQAAQDGLYVWKLHFRSYYDNFAGEIVETRGKVYLKR